MTNRRSLRSRRPALETTLLLVLTLAASPAAAQLVPLGPPEQVDPQAITSDCPRVAGRENRTFVVVWGEQVLDTATVRARRFDADGPVTGVIFLDGGRLDGRRLRSVDLVSRSGGGDLVLWGSFVPGQPGLRWERADVSPEAVPARVVPPSYIAELFPLASGDLLAVWPSARGTSWLATVLDPAGRRRSRVDVRLNQLPADAGDPRESFVLVEPAPDGTFTAIWASDARPFRLRLRRFAADGRPLGPEVDVSDGIAGAFVLGSGPGGRTAVSWVEPEQGPGGLGGTIFVRFFDASGTPVSEPLEVDRVPPAGSAFNPDAIAVDRFGRALVVWTELRSVTGFERHTVQLWSPDGAESDPLPLGASLPQICVSAAAAGRLWAVAWLDQTPDGTGRFGVLIRRFFAP